MKLLIEEEEEKEEEGGGRGAAAEEEQKQGQGQQQEEQEIQEVEHKKNRKSPLTVNDIKRPYWFSIVHKFSSLILVFSS